MYRICRILIILFINYITAVPAPAGEDARQADYVVVAVGGNGPALGGFEHAQQRAARGALLFGCAGLDLHLAGAAPFIGEQGLLARSLTMCEF